ncbi:MAG TPA: hypothetical protein VM689_25395 [Aliidongia sp.]|nr:hypothetical protein [Aliidongia sp.]
MKLRKIVKAGLAPIAALVAIVYFLIDGVFLSLLRPVGRRIGRLGFVIRLEIWMRSLRPYPALALFLVPLVVLEPAKPIGFFLIGTKRFWAGVLVIGVGEVLKILIVERLFHMSRGKLLSIGWFARGYFFLMGWLDWVKALPAWQVTQRISVRLKTAFRRFWHRLVTG